MKKKYDAPVAEKIGFDYEENVTASSSSIPESVPATPLTPPTQNQYTVVIHHGITFIPVLMRGCRIY